MKYAVAPKLLSAAKPVWNTCCVPGTGSGKRWRATASSPGRRSVQWIEYLQAATAGGPSGLEG